MCISEKYAKRRYIHTTERSNDNELHIEAWHSNAYVIYAWRNVMNIIIIKRENINPLVTNMTKMERHIGAALL